MESELGLYALVTLLSSCLSTIRIIMKYVFVFVFVYCYNNVDNDFVFVYCYNNVDNDESITLSCLTMTMDHLACY